MNRRSEILIIGGGIMGASAAWHCARRGLRTTLLEQFELDHRRGSSHGAARIFRFAYDDVEYVRLAQQALPLWRQAEEALGAQLLLKTGGLDIGPPNDLASVAMALEEAGEPCERLIQPESIRRFPAYTLPEGWEVLYQRDTGVLLADDARAGLLELARRAGAELYSHSRVTRLSPVSTRVVVETDDGNWEVEQVIVTAASWTNQLLEPLGLAIPLRVTREHVAFYPYRDDDAFLPFIWHGSDGPFEFYGLPNGRQDEGKVGEHGAGPETNPDENGAVEAPRIDRITRFVDRYIPGLRSTPSAAETCLYASTPDDDFVVERSGPIVVGAGFGGHGFKFGSIIGQILADLVQTSVASPTKFARDRFDQEMLAAYQR